MMHVKYPDKKPAIKIEGKQELVFCLVRKRWFVITPEEWVRQNFLLYLTEVMGFQLSLIAIEKQIIVGEVKRRFDIVVYENTMQPLILVECKEMGVEINEKVLHQAINYFSVVQSRFILITNGLQTYGFEKKGNQIFAITQLPS
jgi:hypothetical protein